LRIFRETCQKSLKKNIDKALLAIKIKDHINLENGQKLLELDNFDTSKINLSFSEKKLIRERVEHLINLENKKQAQELKESNELSQAQDLLIKLQKENIEMTEQLAELKLLELELMTDIAENIVGPAQKENVKIILDDAMISQKKIARFNNILIESETSSTRHAKKAIAEVSGYIDELLEGKQNKSNSLVACSSSGNITAHKREASNVSKWGVQGKGQSSYF